MYLTQCVVQTTLILSKVMEGKPMHIHSISTQIYKLETLTKETYVKANQGNYGKIQDRQLQAVRKELGRLRVVLDKLITKLTNWYYEIDPPLKTYTQTHDLWCSCRKCEPSIATYHRKLKKVLDEAK